MSNPNGQKGTQAETAVATFLAGFFPQGAERRVKNGVNDRGDIWVPGVNGVFEVKNHSRLELGVWIAEAAVERGNAKADWAVVWHKRRGTTNPGRWYCTLEGYDFMNLLGRAYL